MQPTLMTQPHTAPRGYAAPPIPLPPGTVPQSPRTPSVDTLLRDTPSSQQAASVHADPELMLEPGPGIFTGLRIALMFNAGLGVAAMLMYEAYSMLAH